MGSERVVDVAASSDPGLFTPRWVRSGVATPHILLIPRRKELPPSLRPANCLRPPSYPVQPLLRGSSTPSCGRLGRRHPESPRLASLLPTKPKPIYGSVTEKHLEEGDEVDCVLLSASKILNSSEEVKESGGSETGKISKAKSPMAVIFLSFTTGNGYVA